MDISPLVTPLPAQFTGNSSESCTVQGQLVASDVDFLYLPVHGGYSSIPLESTPFLYEAMYNARYMPLTAGRYILSVDCAQITLFKWGQDELVFQYYMDGKDTTVNHVLLEEWIQASNLPHAEELLQDVGPLSRHRRERSESRSRSPAHAKRRRQE